MSGETGMRSEEEARRAIDLYADTVRRICMIHLKNYADTEDIFQTVFLKYVLHTAPFDSPEHEKAWIIRVTINACRDLLRNVFRNRTVSLDQLIEKPQDMPRILFRTAGSCAVASGKVQRCYISPLL